MSEGAEDSAIRAARERGRRTEEYLAGERGISIEPGPKPRPYGTGRVEDEEREPRAPEPVDFVGMEKCRETCGSLKDDLGTMNKLELDDWRTNVSQNRDEAAARRDLADWTAFQREVGCVTKWTEQCEAELSECDKDCHELREDFQAGTDNVLSKQARDFISNQSIEKLDDITLPRNEVVEASKQLKCLLKYEDCITGRKK